MSRSTVFLLTGVLLSIVYYHVAKTPTANNLQNPKSPWRQPRLNVDLCVTIHNEIVRLGWEGSGRDPQDFKPLEYPLENEKEFRKVLSSDLISFLQRAHVPPENLHFHYWVAGLAGIHANRLFWGSFFKSERKRFVLLYAATDLDADPLGIIFDQHFNTATFCMHTDDIGYIENGRTRWYPLESVLEALRDTIKAGKIKAIRHDDTETSVEYHPWVQVPYTERGLEETLDVYDKLLEAIEKRIGGLSHTDNSTIGLVTEDDLYNANILDAFSRKFVLRARQPHFKYIAPGLQVINPTTFAENVFLTVFHDSQFDSHLEHRELAPPIPLFHSDQECYHPVAKTRRGYRPSFDYPFSTVERFPAGLYLNSVEHGFHLWDDESTLVLPYAIGSNGFAQKSDGTMYGDQAYGQMPEARDTPTGIYQPGHRPFGPAHRPLLKDILEHWLMMVDKGHWKIGPDGVKGGIEEWKKADRRRTWELYVLPARW